MTTSHEQILEAIELERNWRMQLVLDGTPFHYWQERGDAEAPNREYWCIRCVGYYGVPHTHHDADELCEYIYRSAGMGSYCACIDCKVSYGILNLPAPST